jgi:APA family basic amino acid/polyamine antiporter
MATVESKEVTLKRSLGLFSSTMLVVGLLVGSGVFKKIVPMAQTGMGETAILMAWATAGIISLIGAFTVGALSSLTEESGGVYEYIKLSFGKFPAFLSGWADFMVIGPGAIAAIAFLFAQIVHSVAPVPDPLKSWEHVSIAGFIFPFAQSGVKLVGIISIVFLTGINWLGSHESGVINNIITSAKVIGILVLIFLGLTYPSPQVTEVSGLLSNAPEGMMFYSAFLTAMLSAFWAYNGWDTATSISGEVINPKRNMPLAMAYGILIVMAVYVLCNFAYMHVMPLEKLRGIGENDIGALVFAETLLGNFGRVFFLALLVICVFGCLNSNIVAVPRKYFRMAQEGVFFRNVAHVHPRYRTPHVALTYSMVWSCTLLMSGTFDMLTDMVIFVSFLVYVVLAFAVFKMKRNGTITTKVIGYPWVPLAFLLFSVAFVLNTIWVQPKQTLLGALLILGGVPFFYYFRSKAKPG